MVSLLYTYWRCRHNVQSVFTTWWYTEAENMSAVSLMWETSPSQKMSVLLSKCTQLLSCVTDRRKALNVSVTQWCVCSVSVLHDGCRCWTWWNRLNAVCSPADRHGSKTTGTKTQQLNGIHLHHCDAHTWRLIPLLFYLLLIYFISLYFSFSVSFILFLIFKMIFFISINVNFILLFSVFYIQHFLSFLFLIILIINVFSLFVFLLFSLSLLFNSSLSFSVNLKKDIFLILSLLF